MIIWSRKNSISTLEKYNYAVWVKILHPKSKTVILTVSYVDEDGETQYDRQAVRELKVRVEKR